MLGKLHLFALTMLVGAMGLWWFYGRLFPGISEWVVLVALLLPWLTVHVLTFSAVSPVGPRSFRRCLLLVACAYALLTAGAEVIQAVYQLPADGAISVTVARVLMYVGCVSIVPFVRSYLLLRDLKPAAAA